MARFEKEGYEYMGYALGETVKWWGNKAKIVGFHEDKYTYDLDDLCVLIAYSTEGSCKLNEAMNSGYNDSATYLAGLNENLEVYWAEFREISKVEKEDEEFKNIFK